MTISVTDKPAPIRFAADCTGHVWYSDDTYNPGWHGYLKYDTEGATNFVGPFATALGAQQALRAEYIASLKVLTDPPIIRGL